MATQGQCCGQGKRQQPVASRVSDQGDAAKNRLKLWGNGLLYAGEVAMAYTMLVCKI